MKTRRVVVLGLGLGFLLIVLVMLRGEDASQPISPQPPQALTTKRERQTPVPLSGVSALPSDEDDAEEGGPPPPDETAAGILQAYSDVAEALGYVAIRCYVGPEYDSDDYVGKIPQRVSNGWYTYIADTLRGTKYVERRYPVKDVDADASLMEHLGALDFETLFIVSWEAQQPGQTVPCTISYPKFAELRVTPRDQNGEVIDDVRVHGCGGQRTREGDEIVFADVFAEEEEPCFLKASCPADGVSCGGVLELPPFNEHEVRSVEFPIAYYEMEGLSWQERFEILKELDEIRSAVVSERSGDEVEGKEVVRLGRSLVEELDAFEAVSQRGGLSPSGQEAVSALIERHNRLIDRREAWAEHEAHVDALKADLDAARARGDTEQAKRLRDEWSAALDDMILGR